MPFGHTYWPRGSTIPYSVTFKTDFFKALYKAKNFLNYDFKSFTKTVKDIGQPGDSFVARLQMHFFQNVRNFPKLICFYFYCEYSEYIITCMTVQKLHEINISY